MIGNTPVIYWKIYKLQLSKHALEKSQKIFKNFKKSHFFNIRK